MSEEKQREKQKAYEKYVKKITPVHNLPLNMLKAFLTGGLICVLGQLILNTASSIGADKETAGNWCSLLLIFISVILTGLNVYSKIGKFGGAGGFGPLLPVSPILLPHRLSNTVQKVRSSESAARFLRLQDRSSCTEFSRAGCLE